LVERFALSGRLAKLSGPSGNVTPKAEPVLVFGRGSRQEARDCFLNVGDADRLLEVSVAADFQGALKSGIITRMSQASTTFGFAHPREFPARIFYQHRFETSASHVIEQYHALAEAVAGKSLTPGATIFPRDERAQACIEKKISSFNENFVIINPGAGWRSKQWPAARYGEVARALSLSGLFPLINFGPNEHQLAYEVQTASGGSAQPISCSISELIALTRRARLFIGGDTGPLHLAAALKVPVVAIFGPTDPARNGPYGTKSTVLRNPVSRTSLSHTRAPDPGLLAISADEVISAARELLRSTSAWLE
jgi:heptosyltransferase-1